MTGFNFSINSNESSISTTKNTRLKPFEIHSVTFDGAEIKEGTSKAGNEFKLLSLSFSNSDGSADLTIFWPNPESDGIRPERTARDGHTYLAPSRWDQTKAVIAQTLEVLNPDGYTKFKELSSKFKSFDDMAKAFVTLVNKKKGDNVDVKFNGYVNKQGYTQLTFPNIVGLNKENELFISDNYIGHGNLGLSEYELNRAKALNEAKPTVMKDDPIMDTTDNKSVVDELDFENL
jgi:hypothetical protein